MAVSEGYSFNENQINYLKPGKSESLATVSGVVSSAALEMDTTNKKVTVGNDSLNQQTVTISDGYTLELADDVKKSSTTDAGWSYDNDAATYKTKSTTEGYSVIDNQIVYSEKVTGSPKIILGGTAENASLPIPIDEVITFPSKVLGASTSLKSNDGSYIVELNGDMNEKIFTGSDKDDTLNIGLITRL